MDALDVPGVLGRGRARAGSRSRSRGRSKVRELERKDYAIGIGMLLVVVFLWTLSSFVTQDLFEDGFDKPFFVTYTNTGAFTLYLLPVLYRRIRQGRLERREGDVGGGSLRQDYEPLLDEDDLTASEIAQARRLYVPSESSMGDAAALPLTQRETAKLAAVFCFYWFIANWSVNAALDYTSVASATILSSTSGFFTLGIGRLFRVETLTLVKIGAVLTSFAGVALVSLSDSSRAEADGGAHREPFFGDFLALVSAAFYAVYVVLLKVRIGDESRIDMQLFFGFVGLFNLLACWPIAVLLHVTGVEPFEVPHGGKIVAAILFNALITWSSDYIYVLAMLKTTPLVVTVGLSLTIPVAVAGDFLLGRAARAQVIAGALLVLASFVAVGVADSSAAEDRDLLSGNRLHDEPPPPPVRLQEDGPFGPAYSDA